MGKRVWVISGGYINIESTGHEPELTSHDTVAVLNTGNRGTKLSIEIFYSDRKQEGAHHILVDAQRVRLIRFNDLIDPEPILLGKAFGAVIKSSEAIVVQFSKQTTASSALSEITTLGYCE
ncbi:sensory rhodopsin transducer [Chitinispirillales bacterium ANBcel5]|uniref:sensory rhodopsin transducer n=1 Tax=Cellulosispirillum alkaliphilum TaxID=3039283 RepID=UPI002A4F007D|nr:sensory rhodopsin transducer [Chitinispirillales bacterium ANBcel5]